MKKQEGAFLLKRDKVRERVIMKRLVTRNNLYKKLMGQQYNKKYNVPLNDSELQELDRGLNEVIEVCKDLKDELHRKD